MSRSNSKPLSQRQLRVGELIRKELSDLLLREAIHDEQLYGVFLMINQVRMSPDLKLATAYVGALNLSPQELESKVAILKKYVKPLRGMLGGRLSMKFTPEIRFKADNMLEQAYKIDKLLASEKVRRDVAQTPSLPKEDEA